MKTLSLLCTGLACVFLNVSMGHAAFVDPIDSPAVLIPHPEQSFLTAVTKAPSGNWVAVGRRGHILLSNDAKHWRQTASVPVSTDLVGVFFINAKKGWAVGHGGVVIATTDGGEHWTKQIDGHKVAELLVKFYEPLVSEGADSKSAFLLQDAIRLKESGPGRPFLDIWFSDEKHGYAVGAYSLLFTTEDGGNTWMPRPDLIDNEKELHLSTITSIGGDLYIAGEQGLLARRNSKSGRFERVGTPYAGSLFGLAGNENLLVLFGLQGNAFRSRDKGKNWEKIEPGLKGTITSGSVFADGRLVLASQTGQLAVSTDGGGTFSLVRPAVPAPIYAIAAIDDGVITVGKLGVKTESLKQEKQNGDR